MEIYKQPQLSTQERATNNKLGEISNNSVLADIKIDHLYEGLIVLNEAIDKVKCGESKDTILNYLNDKGYSFVDARELYVSLLKRYKTK